MANTSHTDAQIADYQKEIEERSAFIDSISGAARERGTDITDTELELIKDSQRRVEAVEAQLKVLEDSRGVQLLARQRAEDLQKAMATMRATVDKGEVEYRSAGHYLVDSIKAQTGSREAMERLELFYRAAAHQKTSDNLGVVPDPVIGPVLNVIDAARPLVSAIGPEPLPSNTFYLPIVGQHTVVDVQGTAGLAADEKSELDSQKMTITRKTVNAVTYGGYVNVSRQNIDFSSPSIMDIIVDDLAAQYAIKTEAAVATELDTSTATAVGYGASPTAATVTSAIWAAAGDVFAAMKGQGRLILAVAPDRLELFGPLFPPIGVTNGQSQGLFAGNYTQGFAGGISGVQVLMSARARLDQGLPVLDRGDPRVRAAGRDVAGDGAQRPRSPGGLRRVLRGGEHRRRRNHRTDRNLI